MSAEADGLPRRFGSYLLFDEIGEGGMARIYLAHARTELGGERLAVVKQILPLLARSQAFCRLLVEEAKLSAQLSHSNVAQVFDLGEFEGVLFIAMEYVEGFDLGDLLRQCSRRRLPVPVELSLQIVTEAVRALDYAHRKRDAKGRPLQVVHRDVSPSNVLVSFAGEVKLCDFGIARALTEASREGPGGPAVDGTTTEAGIKGKVSYMSPEAAQAASLDGRADVFAIGVVLWELLAGRRYYKHRLGRAPTLEEVFTLDGVPLPPRGLPEELRLQRLVASCLEREPANRPTSRELLRELEDYADAAGLVTSPLRLGQWLTAHLAEEVVTRRRERERAAKLALEAESAAGSAAG